MPPRKQAPQPLPTTIENPDASDMEGREERIADTALAAIGEDENTIQAVNAYMVAADKLAEDIKTVQVVDGEDQFAQPVSRNENWVVVEELFDDEFQVEVANIDGYQMRKSILRFRVRGELMPNVVVMDGIRYHPTQGFQKR